MSGETLVLLYFRFESEQAICAILRDCPFCLAQKILPSKFFCRLFSEALYARQTLVIMSPAKTEFWRSCARLFDVVSLRTVFPNTLSIVDGLAVKICGPSVHRGISAYIKPS
jgi:hypothetical protein